MYLREACAIMDMQLASEIGRLDSGTKDIKHPPVKNTTSRLNVQPHTTTAPWLSS